MICTLYQYACRILSYPAFLTFGLNVAYHWYQYSTVGLVPQLLNQTAKRYMLNFYCCVIAAVGDAGYETTYIEPGSHVTAA